VPSLTPTPAGFDRRELADGEVSGNAADTNSFILALRVSSTNWLELYRFTAKTAAAMAARRDSGDAELAGDAVSSDGKATNSFPVLR
jgi:hypothetical protein